MKPVPAARESLVRAIGVVGLAAGIVNVTVGGGIFRLPADVARTLGPAAPLAYVACAVTMGFIVLCMAEAGSRVDLTGGPYAYVETAFGPYAGFLAGVLLWSTGALATSAVSVVFAANAAQLFPPIATRAGTAVFLGVVLAVLSAINMRGVEKGTALNVTATAAKLLPLVLLVLAGPFFLDTARVIPEGLPTASAVARTSALLVFAFAGIECALVPSGEVKDVSRTIPRAIAIAMVTVTFLYIALQVIAQGVLGDGLATSPTPLADTAQRMFGTAGRTVVLVGAAVSMFGYVSGMTLAIPRALYAFGRDGFFPKVLAAVHPVHHTPHVAIAVQSALVWVLAVTASFERLALLANVNILVVYAACCVAAAELRRKGVRTGGIPFAVPGGGAAPLLGTLAIAGILTGVSRGEWIAFAMIVALATGVFLMTARSRAALGTSGRLD